MLKIYRLMTHLGLIVVPLFGQYSIIDLRLAPGTSGGGPIGSQSINSSGQVVGGFSAAGGAIHAFLWLPTPAYGMPAGFTDLGILPGRGPWSYANDINDLGQVVGRSGDLISGSTRGFIWDSRNGMVDLGALPGNSDSGAYGVNRSGQVVGYSANYSGDPNTRAVLWSNGSIADVAGFGGSSSAGGISNSGQVAFGAAGGLFRWNPTVPNGITGNVTNLGATLGGGRRINGLGQIACVKYDTQHACVWDNGAVIDLGTLGGYSESESINDLGQVVGTFQMTNGIFHAFILSRGAFQDLNSMLPSGSPWELNRATGINSSGQIVGWGTINGEVHSFLMTPAAPLYRICPLFDSTKPAQSAATIPVRLQLCTNSGSNLSISTIALHATGVTQVSNSVSGPAQASGNSNPGNSFRFDSSLGGTGGYIFNLSTKGLTSGFYNLTFTVNGDSHIYATPFQIR